MTDKEEKTSVWKTLRDLTDRGETKQIRAMLRSLTPARTTRAIYRMGDQYARRVLSLLRPKEAARVLTDLPVEQAADLIEHLPPDKAALIVDALPEDHQADLLGEMDTDDADAILDEMEPSHSEHTRELLKYEPHVAGGIMSTAFLSYVDTSTVGDVYIDLQINRDRYADYDIQYTYVTTAEGVIRGVLRTRDLLMSSHRSPVTEIMIANPVCVMATDSLDDLMQIFSEHNYLGLPVVDEELQLVGVVRRGAVMAAEAAREKSIFLKVSGIVGGEELRSMPMLVRSARRLSWLAPNIVLNIMAASVIAAYQETLQAAIALAVFLPIISDMSGCSGNQAVAVTIRELTLRLIRPSDAARVLLKEVGIGLINGLVLGTLLGSIAYLWKQNVYLGLVVGAALGLNTLVSVTIGSMIPLMLKKFRVDPALASGPILTTMTDLLGFFCLLSLATQVLSRLM